MDTWTILNKELAYYGINLTDNKKCQVYENDNIVNLGIIKLQRQIRKNIKKQKKIILSLLNDIINLLKEENLNNNLIYDDKIINLFIFSLKDLSKFLLCFDEFDNSLISACISSALNRDIKSYTKYQIDNFIDYKISIDWIYRQINRLLYITNLLSFAVLGPEKISQYKIKIAKGITGPWGNLDLPMGERVYPFSQTDLPETSKNKERQRRYRKGLENKNGPNMFEGHYWRELRNEPFDWDDRENSSPYPSRASLIR